MGENQYKLKSKNSLDWISRAPASPIYLGFRHRIYALGICFPRAKKYATWTRVASFLRFLFTRNIFLGPKLDSNWEHCTWVSHRCKIWWQGLNKAVWVYAVQQNRARRKEPHCKTAPCHQNHAPKPRRGKKCSGARESYPQRILRRACFCYTGHTQIVCLQNHTFSFNHQTSLY